MCLFVAVMLGLTASGGTEPPPVYLRHWGSFGDPVPLQAAYALAVDDGGNVYVSQGSYGLLKFTGDGEYLMTLGGMRGAGGCAVDASGRVYALHTATVDVYAPDGTLTDSWPLPDADSRTSPYGIALDDSGNVYVTESDRRRVIKFAPNGTVVKTWGRGGLNDGEFFTIAGICVSSGIVSVADRFRDVKIQSFTTDGVFLSKWGTYATIGSPRQIAADSAGNIYICDYSNGPTGATALARKFTPNGKLITEWGEPGGQGAGELSSPSGVAVDRAGNIFISQPGECCSGYPRVTKFGSAATPTQRTTWGDLKSRYR